MGWRRSAIHVSDECELVDTLEGRFKGLEELARVSVDGDTKRQPMSERTADAVLTYADELEEAATTVRRLDNERHDALEEAFDLPELTIARILSGEVEVESADITFSENGDGN